jgi:hypothetical protein
VSYVSGGCRIRILAAATVPVLGFYVAYCFVMLSAFGVWTYSGISRITVARYLVPACISMTESGSWNNSAIAAIQDHWLPHGLSPYDPSQYDQVGDIVQSTLWEMRNTVPRAVGMILYMNLPRPFNTHELPGKLEFARQIEGLGKIASYCLICVAFGAGLHASAARAYQRRFAIPLLFTLVCFAAATSISFWEGARLMFPVEWALFALVAVGSQGAVSTSASSV